MTRVAGSEAWCLSKYLFGVHIMQLCPQARKHIIIIFDSYEMGMRQCVVGFMGQRDGMRCVVGRMGQRDEMLLGSLAARPK